MEIEIPNVDLTTVETGIPILSDGLYEVKVADLEIVPTKDGQGQLLSIKYTLEQHAQSVTGEAVAPGFPIYDRISLRITEKYTPAKRLAALQDCFLSERTPKLNTEDLIGKVGTIRLRIREDEKYGTSNEVKAYEKKA